MDAWGESKLRGRSWNTKYHWKRGRWEEVKASLRAAVPHCLQESRWTWEPGSAWPPSCPMCVGRAWMFLFEINLALISMGFGGIRARSTFSCLVSWQFQVIFNSFGVKWPQILKIFKTEETNHFSWSEITFYSFDMKPSTSSLNSKSHLKIKDIAKERRKIVCFKPTAMKSNFRVFQSLPVRRSVKLRHLLSPMKKSPNSIASAQSTKSFHLPLSTIYSLFPKGQSTFQDLHVFPGIFKFYW